MKRLLASVFGLGLILGVVGPSAGQEVAKTRILFIGKEPDHPFGTHMYMHTCGVLAKCVELTPGVQAIVSNGWPKDKSKFADVRTIVLYTNPGAEFLLGGSDREEVETVLKKGVGLVTLHWASSVTKANLERLGPSWLQYMGGTWVSNVGLSGGRSPVKPLLPDHPISRGWKEFEIDDEYYMDPTLKGAKPFVQVRERKGKDVVVGWVYERPDKSRSFGTTLGHFYRNFLDDSFRRMVVNAILWSAHFDIPTTGAPISLDVKDLALPEKK